MNLAYKKILGKFTKVLGFGKTPPPCWEKFPNDIVFFWERTLGKSSQRCKGGRPRKCGKQGGSRRLRWIGAVLLHPSSMPPPPPRTAAMAAISEGNIGTERSGNMYFLKVKLISQNVLYRDQCDNTKILTEHIYVMVHLRNWLLCIITCFYT